MKKPWHWKKERIGQSHLRWIELLLYYLLWNGKHLITWFSILQMRTRNLQKKAKRRRKTMMCPPKRERRSYTMRWDVYHNRIFISIYVILPRFYCFMLAGIHHRIFISIYVILWNSPFLFHVGRYLMWGKRRRGW